MLHDWARAIEDLDKAISLNPRYGNAYQIRAIAKRAIGDAPGAAADLKRALRQNSTKWLIDRGWKGPAVSLDCAV